MLHIALFEPEIPPNTGNIIRLAANTGFQLHLIEPLGFQLDDKRLRRAGLDYSEFARMQVHRDLEAFQDAVQPERVLAMTTHGSVHHHTVDYQSGDVLLFGPETRGLPPAIRDSDWVTHRVRIPMLPDSRSLNLANAVSVVAFEAWRQLDFAGARPESR